MIADYMKLFLLSLLSCALYAQVDEGARLYRANCSQCHGLSGDTITGVDLGHNKFKRASTDAELSGIIMKGIPGTGMPPAAIPPGQALRIVAYLRSLAPEVAPGNAAHGAELFAAKGCVGCHRVLGSGARSGPDLSEIGSFRKLAELQTSITDPDAEIQPENRTFTATTKDGTKIMGHVVNEDSYSYQIFDMKGTPMTLERASLKEASFAKNSAMPSYKGKLSADELTDLVAYLASLKRMDSK
jgi:putative heme-binding domain-containing protein